jgi:hypothetical protein
MVFVTQVSALLQAAGAVEIEVLDHPQGTDFFVGVSCALAGERYEMSQIAPSDAFRERARALILDAVRRFAREHGG